MGYPWLRVLFLVGWLAAAGRRSAYHLWPQVGLEVVNMLVVVAKVVEQSAILLAVMVVLARLVLRFRRRS